MELSALLNKMFIFIVLMVIGYVLARRGLFGPAFTKTASSLVLNVFMVGTILSSMISTGAEQDLRDNGFCDVKGNPWEAFEKLMKGEVQLPKVSYSKILPTYKTIWRTISKQEKEVLE